MKKILIIISIILISVSITIGVSFGIVKAVNKDKDFTNEYFTYEVYDGLEYSNYYDGDYVLYKTYKSEDVSDQTIYGRVYIYYDDTNDKTYKFDWYEHDGYTQDKEVFLGGQVEMIESAFKIKISYYKHDYKEMIIYFKLFNYYYYVDDIENWI